MIFLMWVTLLLQLMALLGWGNLTKALLIKKGLTESSDSIFETALFGFFALAVLGLALHFFIPLSLAISKIVFILGIIFGFGVDFILPNAQKKSGLKNWSAERLLLFRSWGVFVFLTFLMALGAFHENPYSDTGLYHYPAMVWAANEKIVFGISNLYGPYAHQSIWFVLATLFQGFHFSFISGLTPLALAGSEWNAFAFSPETSGFLINSLLVSIALSIFFIDVLRWKKGTQWIVSIYSLVSLLVVCTFLRHLIFAGLGSPSTDVPVGIWGLLVFRQALKIYLPENNSEPKGFQSGAAVLFFAVLFLALGTKLSLLPLGALAIFPVFWLRKKLWLPIMFFALPVGLLLIRTFIQSGCFVYPYEKFCASPTGATNYFTVPWAASRQEIKEAREDVRIYSSGLSPVDLEKENQPTFLENVKLGFQRNEANPIFMASILTFGVGLILMGISFFYQIIEAVRRRKSLIGHERRPCIFMGFIYFMSGVGLVFWLANAPHIRFGYGYFWPIFGLAAVVVVGCQIKGWKFITGKIQNIKMEDYVEPVMKGIAVLCIAYFGGRSPHLYTEFLKSKSLRSEWPRFPHIPYEKVSTYQGIEILRPTYSDKCWKLPQPCSKFVDLGMVEERKWGYLFLYPSTERPWVRK